MICNTWDRARFSLTFLLFFLLISSSSKAADSDLGTHGFANSGDVKIHYVTMGEGPLVVLIHGFPDFWYTWREQMPALAKHFKVVAIDQRGYNKSGQPVGVQAYAMEKLVGDVKAVVEHFDRTQATIVGHDWGGAVAWTFAMTHPEMTERLIILNLPHFNGLRRELANNPAQREASAYARDFQTDQAASKLTAEGLSFWVQDPDAKEKYVQAFKRSSMEGMLNYYKANYPRAPYDQSGEALPPVKCSVLMIHGLKDTALLPGALNDTWEWLESDLTLVTLPHAGHFVQQDASETVTRTILSWLMLKAAETNATVD
jgi:pimeloyl-ACP methyl ester carboxylesterase